MRPRRRRAVRRSRRLSLTSRPERLEPRTLLAGIPSNVFALDDGVVSSPGGTDRFDLEIDAGEFTLGGGRIILGLHVSAAEATEYGTAYVIGPNGNPQQEFIFSLGDADVWVSNVSPHTGGVAFILHVNAPAPVAVVVTITVEEGAPAQFRAP